METIPRPAVIRSGAATLAADLMTAFAERTGLSSVRPPRRYLWTDAFAVCNFLELAKSTPRFRELADDLVEQVHHILARHRPDESRSGWLSGLTGAEAEAHPTRGGLRIGKPLPERDPDEPFDPALEWERDGQYFHYLTRWMHALDQLSRASGDPTGNRWARELAAAAHAAFTYALFQGGPERMFWKMSIDLSRPLVPSMGQHDPLDGLITYVQLRAHWDAETPGPSLDQAIADLTGIAANLDWGTEDPLGLGGLLADANRIAQLNLSAELDGRLLPALLNAAAAGLGAYLRRLPFEQQEQHRLAFRELGLSIGLHAVERMRRGSVPPSASAPLERLAAHLPLIETIESFWLDPAHRRAASWLAHEDINAVMLATSLLPGGYLDIA
jgi:hypothetical protein